jgi:hypothetical protein
MIQPGAFGDIIICAPIAKWYADAGYDVYWPASKKFVDKMLRPLSYVTPIVLDEQELDDDWLRSDVLKCLYLHAKNRYDYVLNLADRGPHPTAELPDETFEECKYRLASVPFGQKHLFCWTNNAARSHDVFVKYVQSKIQGPYAFVHNTSSHEEEIPLPKIDIPIVRCEDFSPEYNIYDWYDVIVGASEIYVSESSIWAFCDGIVDQLTEDRYLLPRIDMGTCRTVSKHWKKDYL